MEPQLELPPLTPAELLAEMKALYDARNYDEEGCHQQADALMVEVLRALGYGAAMDVFEAAHKWYA